MPGCNTEAMHLGEIAAAVAPEAHAALLADQPGWHMSALPTPLLRRLIMQPQHLLSPAVPPMPQHCPDNAAAR
jgi:hypothetical protein